MTRENKTNTRRTCKGGIHLGNNLKRRMINYNINDKGRKNNTGLPDAELDSIARVLYSSIIEYCNSEKGKKNYAEWQKQRQLNIKNQKIVAPL